MVRIALMILLACVFCFGCSSTDDDPVDAAPDVVVDTAAEASQEAAVVDMTPEDQATPEVDAAPDVALEVDAAPDVALDDAEPTG